MYNTRNTRKVTSINDSNNNYNTSNPFDQADTFKEDVDNGRSSSDDDNHSSHSSNSTSNWKQILKEKALSAKESTAVALSRAKEKSAVLGERIKESELMDRVKTGTSSLAGRTREGISTLADRARDKKAEILDKRKHSAESLGTASGPSRGSNLTTENVLFGTSLVEGVHLSRSLQQSNLAIPCLVWICIQFIETHGDGVKEVGIYRLSGSASIVQGLRNRFNAGLGNVKTGDLFSDDEPIDVHAVAGVLKAYIRELPEPLLTKALSDHFTSILSNYDTDSETIPDTPTLQSLTNLCASSQFPLEHRHTLAILCKHLQSIAKNAAVNKMGISNLTIVWSPTSGMAPNVLAFFIRFWEKVIPLPVAVAPIARVVSPFGLAAAHRPNSFPSPAVKPSNKPPPPPPPPSKASRLANNSSNNNDPASFPQTPPSTTSSSSPSTSPSRDDDNNNIKQTVCRQSFPSTTSSPPHYSTYSSQSSQQSLSPPVAPRPVTHRPASSTLQNVVADFQQQASISGWDKFSLKPT